MATAMAKLVNRFDSDMKTGADLAEGDRLGSLDDLTPMWKPRWKHACTS